MISCSPFMDRGFMRVFGPTPNADIVVTREAEGLPTVVLRGGAKNVTTGGISLDDTEAPLGVPLIYRAQITGITSAERIIQQNLMPTPTFIHGVQGWTAGAGRTLTVTADATAHSASIGAVSGSGLGVAPAAPPTLIGHVDSTVFAAASYTLTPPTGGGTAIATNDWMLLVHQQLAAVAAPVTPTGWTLLTDSTSGAIRQFMWKRKRLAGDTGYTVAALSGAASIGTLLWVRSAIDEIWATTPTGPAILGASTDLVSGTITALRPRFTLTMFGGDTGIDATPPAAIALTGGSTWQYIRSSGTASRSLAVASFSSTEGGETTQQTLAYAEALLGGVASCVVFQSTNAIIDRVIAKAKTTALPAATEPYLLTGRFKFTSAGLNLWSDIKAVGTWLQVRTAKATWLAARGLSSTIPGDYLQVFLTIVNPSTQADYITPIQVRLAGEQMVGQWVDFSFLFDAPIGGIPDTAEVRISHGASLRQYAVQWSLDEFGITPGIQREHSTLYWFDGDSPVPPTPVIYLWPGWEAVGADSTVAWAGTPGNSVSVFTGPGVISTSTTCQLDMAAAAQIMPCEPVLLSDPVNVNLSIWVGLLHIDPLNHPSKQVVHQIINRAPSIVISQVRGWEVGTVTLLTMSIADRARLLAVIKSGRVLLLRNPRPEYPENNWFIAIGDVTEDRPVPNQRVGIREWTMPFVRVERPTGMIEASSGRTWQEVKDSGAWDNLRAVKLDWLDVLLTPEPVG